MTDLLGPAAAGCPRTLPATNPSITSTIQFPAAADSFFGDCVANTPGTGTPPNSEYENRVLQQLRRVIRNSGSALNYADDLLGYAMQQGLQWVGAFGGTANVLTAALTPAPPLLLPGVEIKGFVAASNTGPATLNVGGFGAQPITGADGSALTGGEMVIGGIASFIYVGTAFVLLSPGPAIFQRILAVPTTFQVNNSTGSDTTGNGTTATPWASITRALAVTSTYNLGGNTITIQLALTGVVYTKPPIFAPPSNGTLVIRGDPAAQGSYVIQDASPTNQGVVEVSGSGSVELVGVTVRNTAAAGSGVFSQAGGQITLIDVSLQTAVAGSTALMSSNVGGLINIGSGCIIGGASGSALLIQSGGAITQGANASVAGSVAFSAGFINSQGGYFAVATSGLSWSGSCTAQRYSAALNGIINTGGGGANFFPGTSAGTTSTGGQYA